MKKVVVVLLFIFLLSLGLALAKNQKQNSEYYLGEEYKKEITKIINEEYPKAIKEIDHVFVEFEEEENPYEKSHILDDGIRYVLTGFYIKLYDTTEKYTKLKELATDYHGDLQEELDPYLKNNNIKKINALNKYADKKQLEIEKRRDEIVYSLSI